LTIVPGKRVVWLLGSSLIAALIGIGAAAWWLGARQAAPNLHPVGSAPSDLSASPVEIMSLSGSPVGGWLVPGRTDAAVLLLHGSGGDRRSMMGRARMLNAAGYTALTIDLQANGESPGRAMTEGYRESLDARAAVGWLREQPGVRRVAIIGFSLGGAAALLGPEGPVAADALVLEAVYPTIEEAIADRVRIRLGPWSGWLYPLFTWQIGPRLGIRPADLRPIDRIGALRAPVLVIGGGADRHTTPEETRRLFAAAPQPKRLWIVPGAAHGDFQAASPAEYRRHVLDFLDWSLVPRFHRRQ
jgi:pimeloyl-ACP methyl ester carboxylesterase